MKYIFSLDGAYSHVNYIVSRNDVPLEYSVFSDIMFNYIQACVRRWYFGFDYNKNIAMLKVGLGRYLLESEIDIYLNYLDNSFWPVINNCIIEDITDKTMVLVTIASDRSLMLEIKPELTSLDVVLDRVCIDVEHKLYSGEYIDPILKEIYDARQPTNELSN